MNKWLFALSAGAFGLVLISLSPVSYATIGGIPIDGLVGHWPLDEVTDTSASDSSGNGNHGILVNGPTWVSGIAGNALNFTAASGSLNNYVSFPESLQNASFPTSGTLAFWINGDFATQDNKCIFDCWAARNHVVVRAKLGTLQILLQDPSGYLNQRGSSKYKNPAITTSETNIPIAANTWTHFALAWDTTNDMGYIYKDGILAVSFYFGSYNGTWTPSEQVFKINDASAASAELIDDVVLYNRPLSPTEIEAIYAGTTPPPVDTTSPSAPVGLAASSLSTTSIALGWNASTDDAAIGGYVIYRNDAQVGKVSPSALAYVDSGLSPSTSYTYTVYAFDTSGNRTASIPVVATTSGNASILFHSDFEQNALSPSAGIAGWTQNGPNDEAVTVTTEQPRVGTKSAKLSFNYSDWDGADTSNHERAQIRQVTQTSFNLGETYWIGFSQFMPSTWENDLNTNAELLWQFHGADNGPAGRSSPPLALIIYGDTAKITLRANATEYYDTAPPSIALLTIPVAELKGVWTDWVLQVKFDFNAGVVKVWRNGVPVVDYSGPTIYHQANETNQNGPYATFNIYKWGWGDSATQVSNRTAYVDEVRIGTAAASCDLVKPVGSPTCVQNEDLTPPAVWVTAPSDGANVSGTVTITATATDDIGVAKVEFFVDGSLIGTDTSAPYAETWNSANAAHNSSHILTAKAYDDAGNLGVSQAINVNVLDVTVPTVSITTPANGALVSRNSTVTIQATASDVSGITKVEFSVNGALKCTDIVSPYSCAWSVPHGKNIQHLLQAKAYDPAGQTAVATIQVVSK